MADDKIYGFDVKIDVKADGVALPTISASIKTTGIIKENCSIDGGQKAIAVKIPKFTEDPQFVLLIPLPGKKDDPAPNLTYSFGGGDKKKPLAAPQVFFNGAEAWLGATNVEAITFWADNPVTVQIIIGFNAGPPPPRAGA